jgi:hypothetical protein
MRTRVTLFAALLAVSTSTAAIAATADASVKQKLDAKGTPYKVDQDGDYEITVRFRDDNNRGQVVYVRSEIDNTDRHRIRQIWSYAWGGDGDQFPAALANRLLESSATKILGAWAKHGKRAVFVIRLDADASADELDEAIDFAASVADDMEKELSEGRDEL